jgi:hypothetical protein
MCSLNYFLELKNSPQILHLEIIPMDEPESSAGGNDGGNTDKAGIVDDLGPIPIQRLWGLSHIVHPFIFPCSTTA